MTRWLALVVAVVALLVQVPLSAGFGSFSIPFQQQAVHSAITGAALACFGKPGPQAERDVPGRCFEPDSITSLAGRGVPTSVGAVEAPDLERYFDEFPHCTGGDLLTGVAYPRTVAQQRLALVGCREHMLQRFAAAAVEAARVVDPNGDVRLREAAGTGCTFVDRRLVAAETASSWKDYLTVKSKLTTLQAATYRVTRTVVLRAAAANEGAIGPSSKCAALYELGGALHGLQDAYAHGNWTDLPKPGRITTENAPGLGKRAINGYLRMGTGGGGLPKGWITACYSDLIDCAGRVDHAHLAKDNGDVTVARSGFARAGLTVGAADEPRGEKPYAGAPSNFAQTVTVAYQHTQLLWMELGQRLVRIHGRPRATQMICALTHDNPAADCGLPKLVHGTRGVHNRTKALSSVCTTVIAPPDMTIAATLEPAGSVIAPAAAIRLIGNESAAYLGLTSSNPTSPQYRWVGRFLNWVTKGPGAYTVVLTATRYKGTPDEVGFTVRSPIVIPPQAPDAPASQTWGGLVTQLGCPLEAP